MSMPQRIDGIAFRPRHDISCGKIRAIVKMIRNYGEKKRAQTNKRTERSNLGSDMICVIGYLVESMFLWCAPFSNAGSHFFFSLRIEDGLRQLVLYSNVYNHRSALEIMKGTVYVSDRRFSISIVIHFDFPITIALHSVYSEKFTNQRCHFFLTVSNSF